MTNILISGANGFVGENLCDYLQERGLSIGRLIRGPSSKNSDEFSWDQLEKIKFGSFRTIIHLAGKAHDLSASSDDEEYIWANVHRTKELFTAFIHSSARDFVYFSSVKAVADSVTDVLFEDDVPHPLTPYGKSKKMAEEYLLCTKLPSGKRLFILRPCMIHGPGNKGNLNLLYKIVSKGIPYPLAAFHNSRSFLSIENLCYVVLKLITGETIPGGIYNVADDQVLSTNDVIKIMSQAQNRSPRLIAISPAVVNFIAKIGDKINLPLNSERLKKLTESYVVSNDKIKRVLSINQFPVTATQGLLKTAESFKKF